MNDTWLIRIYVIEKFNDISGFERSNPRLIEHIIFNNINEAHKFTAIIEMTNNLKVIVKPNK